MQSSLPAGWLAFTGRASNPLDRYKRFQITLILLFWIYPGANPLHTCPAVKRLAVFPQCKNDAMNRLVGCRNAAVRPELGVNRTRHQRPSVKNDPTLASTEGQSMSALPGLIRHRFVPKSQGHHRPQCRGIVRFRWKSVDLLRDFGATHKGQRPAIPTYKCSISYSITSSVRASSEIGTSRPSALAVLRLMTSSNLSANWIGRSPGFSHLRMRSTYEAARL
jgi:hypothetical protein